MMTISASEKRLKRPIGLTILSIYMGLNGAYATIVGLAFLFGLAVVSISGRGEFSAFAAALAMFLGVAVVTLGILLFWTARGLWQIRLKAWRIAIWVFAAIVPVSLLVAVTPGLGKYFSWTSFLLVLPQVAVCLWYLFRRQTVELFRFGDATGSGTV